MVRQEIHSGGGLSLTPEVIFAVGPVLGRIILATLLTEAAEPLRSRDYRALRALAGTAPVARRSGKQCFVIRRHVCNGRLKPQSIIGHAAPSSMMRRPATMSYGGTERGLMRHRGCGVDTTYTRIASIMGCKDVFGRLVAHGRFSWLVHLDVLPGLEI